MDLAQLDLIDFRNFLPVSCLLESGEKGESAAAKNDKVNKEELVN